MTPRYAREISALVEGLVMLMEGDMSARACGELLAEARDRQVRSLNLARLTRETVLGHERLVALADQLLTQLRERDALFGELDHQIAGSKQPELIASGKRLQELSFQIATISEQLDRERKMLPQDVPIPALDEALKTVRAMHKGMGDPELLGARVAELVKLHDVFARDAELFRASYPHHQVLGQRLTAALSSYQNAVGSLVHFLEAPKERREALGESVELLQGAAIDLNSGLNAMGQVRRQEGFSEVPVLDAFARAARGGGELSAHYGRLEQFLEEQQADCARFHGTVLLSARGEQVWETSVRPVLERFVTTLEGARGEPSSERKQMELFRLGQELLNKKNAWMDKGAQSRSFAADPLMEELREAVKGWYAGTLPRPYLLGKLERCYQAATSLEIELAGLKTNEQEALLTAVSAVLECLEKLRDACEHDDRPSLALAVQQLETAFDRWLWCRETIRLLQEEKDTVVCVQCGLRNQKVRNCTGCGSPLIWPEDAPDEGGAAVAEDSLFNKLTHALETQGSLSEIRPLLTQCHIVVRDAARRLAAWHKANAQSMGDDADLERVASELEVHVQTLEATLSALLAQGDGSLEDHAEALEDVRELLLRLGESHASLTPADRDWNQDGITG